MKKNIELYLGEHNSGKTTLIKEKLLDYYSKRNTFKSLLVIVRNKDFEERIKKEFSLKTDISTLNIFRFRSFVYFIVSKYWHYLYEKEPEFLGFSETIFLMKEFIRTESKYFNNDNFDKKLVTKIFDRLQRKTENMLSFEELNSISKNIEQKTLNTITNSFLQDFSDWMLKRENPFLDYSLQLEAFMKLVKIAEIKKELILNYGETWFIDDIDDAIPLEQSFYELFWEDIKSFVYTGNEYGGFRRFMGSNPYYLKHLKNSAKVIGLENNEQNFFSQIGKEIYKILVSKELTYNTIQVSKNDKLKHLQVNTYSQLFEELKIILLEITKRVKPKDIAIVIPESNEHLVLELELQLNELNLEVEAIKSSHNFIENQAIISIITILRIVFFKEILEFEKIPKLSSLDFSALLFTVGNVDNLFLAKVRKKLKNDPENWIKFIKENSQKKGALTIKTIQDCLEYCYAKKANLNTKKEYVELINFITEKIFSKDIVNKNKLDLSIFIKMLEGFIHVNNKLSNKNSIVTFINNILSNELSDNPDKEMNLDSNKIKIFTKQKLSELKYSSKVHIWFDIKSDKWKKSHINPIVNPYILSKSWDKDKTWSFFEEEKILSQEQAILFRMLFSLCSQEMYFLSSENDVMGQPNTFEFLNLLLYNL